MTINLSELSDAQLGKLVRKSMTDAALAALVTNRPKAIKTKKKHKAESRRLLVNEQDERSGMESWQRIVVMGVEIPTLALNEVPWHEAAPNSVQDPYRRALAAVGHPRAEEADPFTWRDCKGIHLMLMGNYVLSEEDARKAAVLAGVMGITESEAVERMLNLRPEEPAGTYVWCKDPMDLAEPVSGKRGRCPATHEGQQCKRENHVHVVHLGEGARTFRKA